MEAKTPKKQEIDLTKLSAKELKQLLKKKEAQERKEYEEKKRKYEEYRDKMVIEIIKEAERINKELEGFKTRVFKELDKFRKYAEKYGDIKKSSKGGFGLRTSDGKYLVRLKRDSVIEFDERADLAMSLIHDFLKDKIYKKDRKAYEIIMGLLARNKKGDLDIRRVLILLKMKNQYDDERWNKAIKLLEESTTNRQISYGLVFYKRDETTGKDEPISLSLPTIKIKENQEKTETNGNALQGEQNKA